MNGNDFVISPRPAPTPIIPTPTPTITVVDTATVKQDVELVLKAVDAAVGFVPGNVGDKLRTVVAKIEEVEKTDWFIPLLTFVINAAKNGISTKEAVKEFFNKE